MYKKIRLVKYVSIDLFYEIHNLITKNILNIINYMKLSAEY